MSQAFEQSDICALDTNYFPHDIFAKYPDHRIFANFEKVESSARGIARISPKERHICCTTKMIDQES